MPQPSYAYACARISALEKSLFGRDTVRRMAEGSLEDVQANERVIEVYLGG